VSELLENHGWPEKLSGDANRAIFLVIDHAKNPFTEKYYPLAKEMADKEIIRKSDTATLEDRILMRSLKPQKYGTQTITRMTNTGENAVHVWPVEDAEKVDELRASVGLPPIGLYIQLIENQLKKKLIWDKNLTINDFDDIRF
jgi:hypothetical protein